LALTRNTSESLQTVQLGLPLERGDEIVITTQDYPRMITAWKQRAARDGVVLRFVRLPVPPPSLDDLYDRLITAVTPRTRLLLPQPDGQIFPVQRSGRRGAAAFSASSMAAPRSSMRRPHDFGTVSTGLRAGRRRLSRGGLIPGHSSAGLARRHPVRAIGTYPISIGRDQRCPPLMIHGLRTRLLRGAGCEVNR
jgi:hypothetical protein